MYEKSHFHSWAITFFSPSPLQVNLPYRSIPFYFNLMVYPFILKIDTLLIIYLWLSSMSWRSLHNSIEKYLSFIFIFMLYHVMKLCHNLFNQSSDDELLDCFQALSKIFKNLFSCLVGKGICIMWPKEINQAPRPSLAKVSSTSDSLLHCRGVCRFDHWSGN